MASYTFSHIYVEGDIKDLERLHDAIISLAEKYYEDYSITGYYKLLQHFGISVENIENDSSGIVYCKMENGVLMLKDRCKWGPKINAYKLLENHFPSMKFYWGSYDDYGCLLYTNDTEFKYFKAGYTLVEENEACDVNEFKTFDQLASYVNEHYKATIKTPDDLDAFIKADSDLYMFYVETKVVK